MTGRIITCDHRTFDLPPLTQWQVTYTGSVPCDSYSVTFPYRADMAEILHRAAGFLAMDGETILLRAIVDEYTVDLSGSGLTATITGRGYAARLLDNETRPVTYQAATLAEIVRCHVTPYGISAAEIADVSADSVFTAAAGTSQWKVLEDFCRTYGGFAPRFRQDGKLLAVPEQNSGRRLVIGGDSPVLSCSVREDHYGVLTEVLVIDKTRNASYSVRNQDMADRGGQCRRVVYTPGQSTWAAMRYTGEYQITRSREEEWSAEICLPGAFQAFPGDMVRLELSRLGLAGEYRVAEAENRTSADGETMTLTLKERM